MKKYIIRAALHEEANEGWVWQGEHPSRTTVEIIRKMDGEKFSVFCQTRKIDSNFRDIYNQSPDEKKRLIKANKNHRNDIDLDKASQTIVTGEWYRAALGGFETTKLNVSTGLDDESSFVELEIVPYDKGLNRWLGAFRAAAHHPDIVVRLGTRLGVIGAWLGLVGVGIPLIEMFWAGAFCKFATTLAIVFAFGTIGWLACRSPAFPTLPKNEN